MARRYEPPTNGNRYVGNKSKKEVHDLDNEDTSANGCQIDEMIDAGNAQTFVPDRLSEARRRGYDPCDKCLSGSTR